MANSHGLKSSVVKKQAKARKLAKWKKKSDHSAYIGSENPQVRKNQSYKDRNHYMENKQKFPKRKLKTKNIESLKEQGILDERWFFTKGKKKNFETKSMVDSKGLDFYGMPR
jgi:Tfp pilus assembly major pilin PilA